MHQQNKRPIIAALLALMAVSTTPALAMESGEGQTPPLTKGELERLHINNIILQAQVQGAQLARQLEESSHGTLSTGTAESQGMPYGAPGSQNGIPGGTRPVLIDINGRDNHLRATIRLPSGQTQVVSPGSQLNGTGKTVKSISLTGVTLSDNSQITF